MFHFFCRYINGMKMLLPNEVTGFFINGKPTFINGVSRKLSNHLS